MKLQEEEGAVGVEATTYIHVYIGKQRVAVTYLHVTHEW